MRELQQPETENGEGLSTVLRAGGQRCGAGRQGEPEADVVVAVAGRVVVAPGGAADAAL